MRFLLGLAILTIPATSMAIVPDPTLSSTPECMRVNVDGSMTVDVAVVGTDGAALGGDEVRLIFSASCTDLVECSGLSPIVFAQNSDGGGMTTFAPEMGGCCEVSSAAEIEADPGAVTLASYPSVGSPDADGMNGVDLVDFTLFSQNFLMTASCHDYVDCDDDVLLTDFTFFQGKFLTVCP